VKLTDGEQAGLWQRKGLTNSLVAYEKYLQAGGDNAQQTARANAKARQLFEEGLALDPGYAMAYAGLAVTYLNDALWGWSKDPRESGRKAYEMAKAALALDDSLDAPHYILGLIYVYMGEFDKAIAEGEKGVELNPNGADAMAFLGYFLNVAGRPAEAITVVDKAMRLNPMPPAYYYGWLGIGYRLTNQFDKAIATLEKGLRVQPGHTICLIQLAAAYSLAGRQEDARKTADEFLRLNPKFSVGVLAKFYKDPAVAEQLIDALRQAGLK
jgi:adenylate cyclase